MKFTLATSVLSQTLSSVLAESSSWSHKNPPGTPPQDRTEYLAPRKNPPSRTRRHGIKNSLVDFLPQSHSPPFTALMSSSTHPTTPCRLSISSSSLSKEDGDADIGILSSCGQGYQCVPVEDKTSSSHPQNSLGAGVCVPLSTSRELQTTNAQCGLCSPFPGITVGKAFYETVIDDTDSDFLGKTCGYMVTAAYKERTIDAVSCPLAAEAVQAAGCCVPMCDLCGVAFEMDYSNANFVVDVPLEGYEAITCGSNDPSPDGLVGAAYFYATIDPDNCPIIRQAAIDAGCCVQVMCYTCGAGLSNITDDYDDGTACADLKVAAYLNETILEEECPAAIQLAQEENCCSIAPTYEDCDICTSDTTFYPDNWVFKAGTCDFVQSRLNPSVCEALSPTLSPMCCSPAPAPFFSVPTSPTPQEEDDTTTPSSAPRTGSTHPWSLVSMMGLTTAASMGTWMLN